MQMYNPPHLGKILHGLYIKPAGLTITQAAKALGITRSALSEIIHAKLATCFPRLFTINQADQFSLLVYTTHLSLSLNALVVNKLTKKTN